MRTSVIIPVFNQLGYTETCLNALDDVTPPGDWEVIVVDNGSTDGTAEWLAGHRLEHAPLRVIHNAENRGFAAACNQGLAMARGEGMLLLNNDAVVCSGWQDGLWRPMVDDPSIGLTGPVCNSTLGRQCLATVPYGQDLIRMAAFGAKRARQFAGQGMQVSLLSGFCLLVRRAVIERIGGLDPGFGVGFFEDNDFSLRAKLGGFDLWICSDVFVHHFGSKTFNGAGFVISDLMARHWQVFKAKWDLPADRQAQISYTTEEIAERWQGDSAVPLFVPLAP